MQPFLIKNQLWKIDTHYLLIVKVLSIVKSPKHLIEYLSTIESITSRSEDWQNNLTVGTFSWR